MKHGNFNAFYMEMMKFMEEPISREQIEKVIVEMGKFRMPKEDLKNYEASDIHRRIFIPKREISNYEVVTILRALVHLFSHDIVYVPYYQIAQRTIPYGKICRVQGYIGEYNYMFFNEEVVVRELSYSNKPGNRHQEFYRIMKDFDSPISILNGKYLEPISPKKMIGKDSIVFPMN